MNKLETKNIMLNGSRSDKLDFLNELDGIFDTYNRNIPNSDEVIDTLIALALISTDEDITDEILEVICSAQISQDLRDVDYDKIANNLNAVPEKFLPRYIDILSNTGDKKYLPAIIHFADHKSKNVQEAVKDALNELQISDHN